MGASAVNMAGMSTNRPNNTPVMKNEIMRMLPFMGECYLDDTKKKRYIPHAQRTLPVTAARVMSKAS